MSVPIPTRTLQECKSCGGGAPVDGDYFAFFGIPRTLNFDPADLDQRFRTLSRQFHPDYFYNASPAERRASLERSSYLNDAYRTLRDPVSRVEYLLGLEGFAARDAAQMPASLLEEVFALNEELDEVRALRASGAAADVWKTKLEHAEQPIEQKRAGHEREMRELFERWDAVVDGRAAEGERDQVLTALRERVLERTYINNLLAGIERELSA